MDNQNNPHNMILNIDEELSPPLSISEAKYLTPIQKSFIESYLNNKDNLSLEKWLYKEISKNLPEYTHEEIAKISDEIISTIKIHDDKTQSLQNAITNGRSKESWFAGELKKATSHMSAQEASKYLQQLDNAINSANSALYRTIYTQSGIINKNPNLDGFIAEQYHAQTFNLNAEASGSQYRAKVLEPNGNVYTKNSVDIVIVDKDGHVVRRYQSKYCKDAEATAKAFEHGDYRGQQKLVPKGQEQEFGKKATITIEAPDGTTSTPLSKERAKILQDEAQSGKWNDLNWNEYKVKDLAVGIGKQAGQAAIMGAACSIGFDIAQKAWNGEKIKGEDLVKTALVSGADTGIKAAAAGALKVSVEKGMINAIPKGTPAGIITNIAYTAIENVKIINKMATGELTAREGVEKIEQTTVASAAGYMSSVKGAYWGAKIGSVLGPVGVTVGGFIGGTIGFMAGSKVGETITKGVQKIRHTATKVIKSVAKTTFNTIKSVASSICSGIKNLLSW